MTQTKKLVRLSLFLAISVIINLIETFYIQIPLPFPGVKLGLANIVGLLVLCFYSSGEYFMIGGIRVILVGLIRGFSYATLIGLGGWLLSSIVVIIIYKTTKASLYGLSLVGAVMHSIGQIFVVAFLYQTLSIVYYLPVLVVLSLLSGYLMALVCKQVLIRLEKVIKIE